MKWIRKRRPSPATGIALAALVVALGGVAFAAIPDSNGTIHGCYQKHRGNLRVIDSDREDCRASEKAISWNQQGAAGATGRSGSASYGDEITLFDTAGFARLTLRIDDVSDEGFSQDVVRVRQTWTNEQAGDKLYLSGPSLGGGTTTVAPGASYAQDNFLAKNGDQDGSFGDMLVVGSGNKVARSEVGIFDQNALDYVYGFHLASSAN